MNAKILAGGSVACLLLFGYYGIFVHPSGRDEAMSPARRVNAGLPVVLDKVIFRDRPVVIDGTSGLEHLVDDSTLRLALASALPRWRPPPVPNLIHGLKLWGPEATFDHWPAGDPISGERMLGVLLSDAKCKAETVQVGADYLVDSPFGIRVLHTGHAEAVGTRCEAHYGQLAMVLGEAGVPSDTPVFTAGRREGTVRDLLTDMQMRFTAGTEPEFAAVAFALWKPPIKHWKNQHGEVWDFNRLVDRLVEQPLGEGACGGCHVPYAIATILRVDEQHDVLESGKRSAAKKYLTELATLLAESINDENCWDRDWTQDESINTFIYGEILADVITVTGHHLEWIAIAPNAARPDGETVRRAIYGLTRKLKLLESLNDPSFKTILPCFHAARALCLLRGNSPSNEWDRLFRISGGQDNIDPITQEID